MFTPPENLQVGSKFSFIECNGRLALEQKATVSDIVDGKIYFHFDKYPETVKVLHGNYLVWKYN